MPVTPYATDLRRQARHDQNIIVELSIKGNLISLMMCGLQYVGRTLGNIIYIWDLKVKRVPLPKVIYV